MILLAFQIGYIRKIPVFLVIVQSVTDHEQVLDLKSDVIRFQIHQSSGWFIQQRADFDALRIAVREMSLEEF